MANHKPRVSLVHGAERRQNIFRALDLVRDDVIPCIRSQVMLKPNFLSGSNQLASSHVDAIRGTIDFVLTTPNPPEEISIAEAGNEKYSGEAWDKYNYRALADEYPIPIQLDIDNGLPATRAASELRREWVHDVSERSPHAS